MSTPRVLATIAGSCLCSLVACQALALPASPPDRSVDRLGQQRFDAYPDRYGNMGRMGDRRFNGYTDRYGNMGRMDDRRFDAYPDRHGNANLHVGQQQRFDCYIDLAGIEICP